MLLNPENRFRLISMIEYKDKQQSLDLVRERDFDILSFRVKGNAEYKFQGKALSLGTNDLMYIPRNTRYMLCSGKEHLIVFHFETTAPQSIAPEKYTPRNPAVFQSDFEAALKTWSARAPGFYQKTMSIFYKVLAEMSLQLDPTYNSSSYHRIKPALDYLHVNYRKHDLSVEQLCRISNLSDTQFRKCFRDVYGTTPLAYINQLRTDYAAELLVSTDLSVERIADESGFLDAKYFAYVFGKYHNRAPSALRLGK